MNLYQYTFDYQPHYAVAESLAEAEKLIHNEMGFGYIIERIENLGPYVLVSPSALSDAEEPEAPA